MGSFAKWNAWLGSHMFVIVLVAFVWGFIAPLPDTPLLRLAIMGFFSYMTFVTSLGTSFREFLRVLKRPWIPLWILFLVHVGTPLVAWAVGHIFYADQPLTRLGYLVGASIPVGVTSLIWTALVKGNLAVSLVAITLDTILVPMYLPLYFQALVGQEIVINYGKMIKDLLIMITIPGLFGMMLHDWTGGKVKSFSQGFGGVTSKAAFFMVIMINASLVVPEMAWNLSMLKMLFVTMTVVASGFGLGFAGSLALKDRTREVMMALVYNVGMRNIASGIVIAVTYFPPAVAVPVSLGMLFQQPIAALVPILERKMKPQAKEA